jgi:hypothetical protein
MATRKSQHKGACNNSTNKSHSTYVYQFIRDHGGWTNWSMILIECIPCNDAHEARLKERGWLEQLHATLNKQIPSRTKRQHSLDHAAAIKEYQRQYRLDNTEAIKDQMRQYYIDNTEAIKAQKRQYNIDHAEAIAAKQRQYNIDHAEAKKEYDRQYYIDNAEAIKAQKRQYNIDHKKLSPVYYNVYTTL